MNNRNPSFMNNSVSEPANPNFTNSSSIASSNLFQHQQSAQLSSKRNNFNKRITSGKANNARRNPPTGPKTRPAFVLKLWNMVNDTAANEKYICWMPDGQSFQVVNREQFEKFVLPKYFKHSNFSSFVRQLNMYGWHKVQDVTSGAMHQSSDEIWQFKSPNFIRDHENLLDNIVRNKGSKGSDDEDDDVSKLFDELEMIKSNQKSIATDLGQMRKDNDLLWRECYESRERHKSHSEAFEKILRFLASVYTSNQTKFVNNGAQSMAGEVEGGNSGGASGSSGNNGNGNNGPKQPLLLLPNLQELSDNKDYANTPEKNSQTLSAIEDLISNASSTPSPHSSQISSIKSHHRISSIGSVDDPRPINLDADTPSSTTSSASPCGNNSTSSSQKQHRRTSSKIKLENVSDEMGPPLTTQTQSSWPIYPTVQNVDQTPKPFNKSIKNDVTMAPKCGSNMNMSMSTYSSQPPGSLSFSNFSHLSSTLAPHISNSFSSPLVNYNNDVISYNNNSSYNKINYNDGGSPQLAQRFLNNEMQSLGSISKNLDMQGRSLQLVQDWVRKLAPDYNLDFAANTAEVGPATGPTTATGVATTTLFGSRGTTVGGPVGGPAGVGRGRVGTATDPNVRKDLNSVSGLGGPSSAMNDPPLSSAAAVLDGDSLGTMPTGLTGISGIPVIDVQTDPNLGAGLGTALGAGLSNNIDTSLGHTLSNNLDMDVPAPDNFNVDDFLNNNELLDENSLSLASLGNASLDNNATNSATNTSVAAAATSMMSQPSSGTSSTTTPLTTVSSSSTTPPSSSSSSAKTYSSSVSSAAAVDPLSKKPSLSSKVVSDPNFQDIHDINTLPSSPNLDSRVPRNPPHNNMIMNDTGLESQLPPAKRFKKN